MSSVNHAGKVSREGSSVQQQQYKNTNRRPSAAKLAKTFVPIRSASHPHRMKQPSGSFNAAPAGNNRSSTMTFAAVPTGGFQAFANELLIRLPTLPKQNIQCPHGATPNIALLAQFLASELRAFVPLETTTMAPATHPTTSPATTKAPNKGQAAARAQKETHHHHLAFENGSSRHPKAANVKLEKVESANVNVSVAPSSGDGVDNEHPNRRTELVYLVKGRGKLGVGPRHLKKSDLSTYFCLTLFEAADELGVSGTTLKKASREFGHKRWPGRKVRSLVSNIDRLKHQIALGQGAGLESKLSKLQQEMAQIVHGTRAQKRSLNCKAAKENGAKEKRKLKAELVPKQH